MSAVSLYWTARMVEHNKTTHCFPFLNKKREETRTRVSFRAPSVPGPCLGRDPGSF